MEEVIDKKKVESKVMGDTLLFGFTTFSVCLYAAAVGHHTVISIISLYLLCLYFEVVSEPFWRYKKAYIYFLDTDVSPLIPFAWVSLTFLSVTILDSFTGIMGHPVIKYYVGPVVVFGILSNIYLGLFYKFGLFEYTQKFLKNPLLKFFRIDGEKVAPWGVPYGNIFFTALIIGPALVNVYYLLVKYWVEFGISQVYPRPSHYNYFIILVLLLLFILSFYRLVKISQKLHTYPKEYEKRKEHNVIPVIFLIFMISFTVLNVVTNTTEVGQEKLIRTWPDGTKIYYNTPPEENVPKFLVWTFDNEDTGLIPNFKAMYLVHTWTIMLVCFLIFRKGFQYVNWVVYLRSFFMLYLFYWFFAWYLGLRGAWIYNNPTNLGIYYYSECIENLFWYYPLGFFNAFCINNWLTKFERKKWQAPAVYIGIIIGTFIYEFACVKIFKMWNFLPEMVWLRYFEYFTIEDWAFYIFFCCISIAVIRYNARSLEIRANQPL